MSDAKALIENPAPPMPDKVKPDGENSPPQDETTPCTTTQTATTHAPIDNPTGTRIDNPTHTATDSTSDNQAPQMPQRKRQRAPSSNPENAGGGGRLRQTDASNEDSARVDDAEGDTRDSPASPTLPTILQGREMPLDHGDGSDMDTPQAHTPRIVNPSDDVMEEGPELVAGLPSRQHSSTAIDLTREMSHPGVVDALQYSPSLLADSGESSSGARSPHDDDQDPGQFADQGSRRRRRRRKRRLEVNKRQIKDFHDRYIVTNEVLGRGAFGVVRGCLNKQSYKRCALKIVSKTERQDRTRVKSEIDILLRCKGQMNIVQLRAFFEDRLTFYFVFERLDGGDLLQNIRRRQRFTEREASLAARDISSALAFLHSQGIVHRDIKPQNVLCRSTDSVSPAKVCDFNLSYNPHFEDRVNFDKAGTIMYMAPEVVEAVYFHEDSRNIPACDVWSFGVVLYLLLAGELPFLGMHRIDSNVEGQLADVRADEVMDDIMEFSYTTEGENWDPVSEEARRLVMQILVPEEERPAIETILEDPWVQGHHHHARPLVTPRILKEKAIQSGLKAFNKHLVDAAQRRYPSRQPRSRAASDHTNDLRNTPEQLFGLQQTDAGDNDVFAGSADPLDHSSSGRPSRTPNSGASSDRPTRSQTLT